MKKIFIDREQITIQQFGIIKRMVQLGIYPFPFTGYSNRRGKIEGICYTIDDDGLWWGTTTPREGDKEYMQHFIQQQ